MNEKGNSTSWKEDVLTMLYKEDRVEPINSAGTSGRLYLTRVLEDFCMKGKFSCKMGIRKRLVLKEEEKSLHYKNIKNTRDENHSEATM